MIELRSIDRHFQVGDQLVRALDGVTLTIADGAELHLPNEGTDIVGSLVIDNVVMEDGVYDTPVARSADSPDLGLGRFIQAR